MFFAEGTVPVFPAVDRQEEMAHAGKKQERISRQMTTSFASNVETSSMDGFHPVIRDWFLSMFHRPTDVQKQAWPLIAANRHLLITAPTGSGKTLTAFLWAINQLASGQWQTGSCRVLYVSPLKALNNDVQQNLIHPLKAIQQGFEAAHLPFPRIQVMTRSGDTPQTQRRKMSIHPPEILITTPESLNLLLSSKTGIAMLHGLKTVILDEIHACAGTKRGVHLITAVDRLVRLSGEFQRIALSATLKDEAPIKEMVGGYLLSGPVHDPVYQPRPVDFIRSDMEKSLQVRVCFPQRPQNLLSDLVPDLVKDQGELPAPGPTADPNSGPQKDKEDSVWDLLAEAFQARLKQNRATLIFTNGRRLCEKLTYKINQAAGTLMAYSHHGSLSRELRQDVEKKLKQGELKAIVATSSLEMGIDIGSLDEVIMVQSPPSISSAVQRIGRAGHQVGAPSCGAIFPAHAQDLIPSAVLARALADRNIEPLKPVKCPLDVLAQILVSMTGCETWNLDELFAVIKTTAPFHRLDRDRFDRVIRMLAGSYAHTRIRELNPRLSLDRLDNTVRAGKGALLALYMSGGTIPDRGYFQLRHAHTRTRIGELDEEFVWEAKKGQLTTLGGRNWKITKITHNDVFALPVGLQGMGAPFWLAESINRDFHFSRLIGEFLEMVQGFLDRGAGGEKELMAHLGSQYSMDPSGADALVRFCRNQAKSAALPHSGRLVLEYVRSGPGATPGTMLVIHTLWGGRVNRPFALALEAAWQETFGYRPEVFPGNDAVVIQLPGPMAPEAVMALVTAHDLERLVRVSLETSGFFGARFRECAGRALLVTRHRINQRMPLWMTRLHAQKLLESILTFPDFPILLETWRTCIEDEFDLPALAGLLEKLNQGEITWSAVHTQTPSPFAAAMAWQQINQYMYQQDQPASRPSDLTSELIRELLFDEALRPKISMDLIRKFEQKRQRLAPGYAPEPDRELLDWVKERVALPLPQWQDLIRAMGVTDRLPETIREKLVMLRPPLASHPLVTALEIARDLTLAWYGGPEQVEILDLDQQKFLTSLPNLSQDRNEDPGEEERGTTFFGQWLGFYGPKTQEEIHACLGLDRELTQEISDNLKETRQIVSGALVLDADEVFICDARNFETLIRMNRAHDRPEFDPLDLDRLPLFLAQIQGLTRPREGQEYLMEVFEQLSCLPLPADLWETQVLPTRIRPYYPAFLDSLMQGGELVWLGREKEQILFGLEQDLELLSTEIRAERPVTENNEAPLPPDHPGKDPLADCFQTLKERHDFNTLKAMTGIGAGALADLIWERVWQKNLSNDTVAALRTGIENKFKRPMNGGPGAVEPGSRWAGIGGVGREQASGIASHRSRPRHRDFSRSQYSRRQGALPLAGHWFHPDMGDGRDTDLVDQEEMGRERVRLLLDRYGILFRELLARELPEFRWKALFKSLYLMELSGEVVAGAFFREIPGPQFASPGALQWLKSRADDDALFRISAMDPASACGLGPLSARLGLPKRLAGNLMVYQGRQLKLISQRQGRQLFIHAGPDDPDLPALLLPLTEMITRQFRPLTRIRVEAINGEDAAKSRFRKRLEEIFEVAADHRTLDLFRKMD